MTDTITNADTATWIRANRELEAEGERTPAQAANDSPPSRVDLAIARTETLLIRRDVIMYLRRLDNRLDALDRGVIMDMPTLERPLPTYLRAQE